MTSLLAPAYELTLGSQRWTQQALAIDVQLTFAPLVDRLCVRLPAAAPFSAVTGDPTSLVLDSGEQEETVFTGAIDSIRRTFEDICIVASNAGQTLARFRPSVTFEQISAGTVIRNLADEVGVETDAIEDGAELAFYVADPTRTAWEHVARLAAWGGALTSVSEDNKVQCRVIDATEADVALLYGRELLWLQADRLDSSVEAWTVTGEGGAGSSSAPEALRPSTDFFAGNRPEGPGAAKRWRFEPALRTVKAAGTAGAALQRQYGASRDAGRLRAFLQPHLRCGTVLEIQQLPEGMSAGPLWIAGARHTLGPQGGFTTARFYKGGDRFDPLALLGSLGGLL